MPPIITEVFLKMENRNKRSKTSGVGVSFWSWKSMHFAHPPDKDAILDYQEVIKEKGWDEYKDEWKIYQYLKQHKYYLLMYCTDEGTEDFQHGFKVGYDKGCEDVQKGFTNLIETFKEWREEK